jgi:hypothetical protein
MILFTASKWTGLTSSKISTGCMPPPVGLPADEENV